MVLEIGTGTNTMKTATKTNSSLDSLSTDFDSFLTLLTTQLKNQDPTSPMETNEFTQQIIGFSQVQQAINTNTNLEKMIEMNKTNAISNAVSYVDQFVVAETDEFNLKNGAAFLSYELAAPAKQTTLTITDSSGKLINAYDVNITKGYHKVTWDGKDRNGNAMANGQYNVSVTARNEAGDVIQGTRTFATELVSQVDLDGEDTIMYFGDVKFNMNKIKSIIGYYAPTDVPVTEMPPVETGSGTTPPVTEPETEIGSDTTTPEPETES